MRVLDSIGSISDGRSNVYAWIHVIGSDAHDRSIDGNPAKLSCSCLDHVVNSFGVWAEYESTRIATRQGESCFSQKH